MGDVPSVDGSRRVILFYGKAAGPGRPEAAPPVCDFGVQPAGYDPVEPVQLQVRNTGGAPLKNLRVWMAAQDLRRFWLCLAWVREELGCAGAEDAVTCFYVYPVDGLEVGRHRGQVRVEADGLEPLTVELRFTVGPGER